MSIYEDMERWCARVVELSKAKPYRPGEERTRADGSVWRKPEGGGPLVMVRGPKRKAKTKATTPKPTQRDFATDFDAAFDKLRRGREFNQIELSLLRKEMPHLSREEFDAGLHALRRADRYELGTSDGRHRQLTPEEIAGGIEERGRQYIYVSRRMPNA